MTITKKITNNIVGKDVEKKISGPLLVGRYIGSYEMEKCIELPQKIKTRTITQSTNSISEYVP